MSEAISSVFLLFLVLCSPILLTNSLEKAELVFVQLLWRHGDRAPIHLYPTDPNPENIWKCGLGQLTSLGKKQQYAMGKLLRKMYNNFTTSSPLEVKVESSDCDRCMDSVEVNLASFYAPTKQWQFQSDIDWQPLPIRYVPVNEDRYLETGSYCPAAFEEQKRIIDSKEGQEFIKENEAMFQYLTDHSGMHVNDWTQASYLFDTLKIEKGYNFTIPTWTATYWDQLRNVSNLSFYWSFYSPLMLRLRAGPLIGKMVDNMVDKIADKLPDQKVQIFSSHDTTVAVLLQALKVYNMQQPPYCATVIVELYQTNTSHMVRFLYLNSSTPELVNQSPHILVLDGCTEYCPFDYVVNYTKDLIPTNWEAECKMRSMFFDIDGKSMTAGILFTFLAVFIIGISGFALWKIYSRNKREYAYHFLRTEAT